MTQDKPSVLVVDDDRRYCNLLTRFLETDGFQVLRADSGRVGLHVLAERDPEVTLLDLNMPDVDGRTFFRQCRATGYKGAVVIVSAYGAAQAQLELGAQAALEEPFELERVSGVVRAVL
jgi:two-component system KDP operon response regulator KdpE